MKKFKIFGIIFAVIIAVLGIGLKVCLRHNENNQIAFEDSVIAESKENFDDENIAEVSQEVVADEVQEITQNASEEQDLSNVKAQENSVTIQTETKQNTSSNTSKSSNQSNLSKTTTTITTKAVETTKTEANTKASENNSEKTQVEQTKTEENKTNSAENNNSAEKQENQTKQENNTEQSKKEEFKQNDTMINKIKQTIQSNESDFMKQYGYTIVVDSSIKTQTTQFTFSESRVKAYLTNKFGTIRIYAEDYYSNGQLVMTECYIL